MQDLVTYLHADGLLTRSETLAIKRAAKDLRETPVRILRSLNVAAPEDIQHCFKVYFNQPLVTDALVANLSSEYAALIPVDIALHYSVFAFGEEGEKLHVAMEDPTDKRTLEALKFFLGRQVAPSAANVYQLSKALETLYGVPPSGSRLETVLDRARGSGAWSISEREFFARILEERRLREQEKARAVSLVVENRSGSQKDAPAPTQAQKPNGPGKERSERGTPSPTAASQTERDALDARNAGSDEDHPSPPVAAEALSSVAPPHEETTEELLLQFEQDGLPELGDDDFAVDEQSPPALELSLAPPPSGHMEGLEASSIETQESLAASLLDEPLLNDDALPELSLETDFESSLTEEATSSPEALLDASETAVPELSEPVEQLVPAELESLLGEEPGQGDSLEPDLPFAEQSASAEFQAEEALSEEGSQDLDSDETVELDGTGSDLSMAGGDEEDSVDHFPDEGFILEGLEGDFGEEAEGPADDLEGVTDVLADDSLESVAGEAECSFAPLSSDEMPEQDTPLASELKPEDTPVASVAPDLPAPGVVVSLAQKAFVKVALASDAKRALDLCNEIFADLGLHFTSEDSGRLVIVWHGEVLGQESLERSPWSGLAGLCRELARKTESKI